MAEAAATDGDGLLARVRARLDADRAVRSLGRYEVAVAEGRATLVGHVRSREVARRMVATAREVSGVADVREQLFADDELEASVAAAIRRCANIGRIGLVVRAQFGHVRIGGLYPTPQVRTDALRAAALVSGVLTAKAVRASDLAPS